MKEEGDTLRPIFEKEYHASGHLSMNDIQKVIDEIDPDILIPVHTEKSDWFKQYESAVIPKNEDTINVS
jgi:ribonuclease J